MDQTIPPSLQPFTAEDTLSLAERAYRRLRDAIVEGSLAAGTRVSERTLAQTLGISAQPVREALWRLETEGMVETLPRRGTVVVGLDERKIAGLNLTRAALEGAAAALAAMSAGPAEVEALRAQLRAMRDATRAADLGALAEANERFHALLHEVAGNIFLRRSIETLRAYDHVVRLRALRSSPREPGRALREHAAVLSAIRDGDPDLAESRMRAHIRRSLRVGGLDGGFRTSSRRKPLA